MTSPDPRALLAESAWLHRLARRLVAEPAGAEDAAQAALVAGLAEAPAAAVPLRSWLAGVLRNVVRQERRSTARRVERVRARPVALEAEAAGELAARLELQERLVARVRALPEPYRTTIALRVLDDLAPREVAARMRVPVKTVHTRVERALARLRAELDREHGGRAAWAALLAPLARAPVPLSPTTSASAGVAVLGPLLAMGTLWKWTGAAAVLALIGYVAVQERHATPARERAPAAPTPARAELAAAATPPIERAPEAVREAVSVASTSASAPPAATCPAAPSRRMLAGRVIDVERRGQPGLEVRFEPTSQMDAPADVAARQPRTTSGADGEFELALPAERGRLLAEGRGYATLLAPGLIGEMPPEPPLVVVAPARTYGGTVVDTTGAPLAQVELLVRLTSALAAELHPGSRAGMVPVARLATDAQGRFLVPSVAHVDGVALEADVAGFERLHLELPPVDALDLVVVLRPLEVAGRTLRGFVSLADGSPARGAWVSAGRSPIRVLEDGSFVLALEPEEEPTAVRAALTGYQPARLELAGLTPSERQSLALELDGTALELAGTVVDGEGRPVHGAQVWSPNGEDFGMVRRRFGEVDFYVPTAVEEVLVSSGDDWSDGRETSTDPEGRFRLRGLVEREYSLLAMHPVTQEIAWLPAVRAGDERVRIVLAGAEAAQEVRGRVLNYAGEPVAGAFVNVYRKRTLPDGSRASKPSDGDFRAESGADGSFRFEALCVEGTHLILNGEMVSSPQDRSLDQEPDLSNVVFRAPAVCHLRVFLADPARADSLMLLDERDKPLALSFIVGSVTLGVDAVPIVNGTSDLIQADESARVLVLTKEGRKERIPLHLSPGEVNELRL